MLSENERRHFLRLNVGRLIGKRLDKLRGRGIAN